MNRMVTLLRGKNSPELDAALAWLDMDLDQEFAEGLRQWKAAVGLATGLGQDLTLRDFDESQHPRDESGKFTESGGGASKSNKLNHSTVKPQGSVRHVKDSASEIEMSASTLIINGQRKITVLSEDEYTNHTDAQQQLTSHLQTIPSNVMHLSNLQTVIAYDNPEDADAFIQVRYTDEYKESSGIAQGVFNRETGEAVISFWDSDNSKNTGRNFFHEFAHSTNLSVSKGWEGAWDEWPLHGQDEGFSEAFADWMVMREDPDYKNKNMPIWDEQYPRTKTFMQELGL